MEEESSSEYFDSRDGSSGHPKKVRGTPRRRNSPSSSSSSSSSSSHKKKNKKAKEEKELRDRVKQGHNISKKNDSRQFRGDGGGNGGPPDGDSSDSSLPHSFRRKREKRRKKKFPSDEEISDDSITGSILTDSPYSSLVNKMKKLIKETNRILESKKDSLEILSLYQRKIEKCRDHFDDKAPKISGLSHHDKDILDNLDYELAALEEKLVLAIATLNNDKERRRQRPRDSLPSWNGSALDWPTFKSELSAVVENFHTNAQKITTLKSCLTGNSKDDMINHIRLCTEYPEAISILERVYGKFELMIEAQMSKLRALVRPEDAADRGRNAAEKREIEAATENSNVQSILLVFRWVQNSCPDHPLGEINHLVIRKLHGRSIQSFIEKFPSIKGVKLNEMMKFLENVQKFNLLTCEFKPEKIKKNFSISARAGNVGQNSRHGAGQTRAEGTSGHVHRNNTQGRQNQSGSRNFHRQCLFCNNDPKLGHENHSTVCCPELLKINNLQHLKNILQSKNICGRCVREGHMDSHNCQTSFVGRNGKTVHRPTCQHNIRDVVCPICRPKSGTTNQSPQNQTGTGPVASSGRPQTVAGHSTSVSTNSPVITNIASHSSGIKALKKPPIVNGSYFGYTTTLAERLILVNHLGERLEVLVKFDQCSQASLCSADLVGFAKQTDGDIPFTLSQIADEKECIGTLLTLNLEMYHGQFQQPVHLLATETTQSSNNIDTLYLPFEWQQKFGMGQTYTVDTSSYQVLLGHDLSWLFPVEIARSGNLILHQSQITGNFLVSGSNLVSQYSQMHPAPALVNESVHSNRINVNLKEQDLFQTFNAPKGVSGDSNQSLTSSQSSVVESDNVAVCSSHSGAGVTQLVNNQSRDENQIFGNQKLNDLTKEDHTDLDIVNNFYQGCEVCKQNSCLAVKRGCKQCEKFFLTSRQEKFAEKMLSSGLTLESGVWFWKPVFNRLIGSVPTYQQECLSFQIMLENKLKNNPDLRDAINEKISKNIEGGTYLRYSDVLKKYPFLADHQMVFNPIHFVEKLNSQSTAVRIVHNFSFSKVFPDGQRSVSLNEAAFSGSSLNSPIQVIMLKLRQSPYLYQSDIRLFYNQIQLRPQAYPYHVFFHKEKGYNSDSNWEIFTCSSLTFGFTSSQFLSNKAKISTSEKYIKPVNPKLHKMLVLDSLTDDILIQSFNPTELRDMAELLERSLAKGNFRLKQWYCTGEEKSKNLGIFNPIDGGGLESPSDENHVLGFFWNCKKDTLSVSQSFNIKGKKRGRKNLAFEITDIHSARKLFKLHPISKRVVLRISRSCYDTLGLYAQLHLNISIIFRKILQECNLQWNDLVPQIYHEDILRCIEMFLEVRNQQFQRCAFLNINSNRISDLCLSVDGGKEAYSFMIYSRYETENGEIDCNLIKAGARLSQKGHVSAVKNETCGFLAGLQALKTCVTVFEDINFQNLYLFSDSNIVLSSVSSNCLNQKLFYASRNYQSSQLIEELGVQMFYVPSKQLDADKISKLDLKNNYALTEKYWKSNWMRQPKNEWPTQKFKFMTDSEITVNPKLVVNSCAIKYSFLDQLMDKYPNYNVLIKKLRILFAWSSKSHFQALLKAKDFILSHNKIDPKVLTGVARKYIVKEAKFGQYLVFPRSMFWGGQRIQPRLHLIAADSKLAACILNAAHLHCSGTAVQISRMFEIGFLVLNARRYFKKLQEKCLTCVNQRQKVVESLMGPNLQFFGEHQKVAKFGIVNFDIIGPFKMKVGRNKTSKIFILVVSCLLTRYSIYTCLENYSADAVLRGLRISCNQVGQSLPHLAFCDRASNLGALSKSDQSADTAANWDVQNTAVENDKYLTGIKRVFSANGISINQHTPFSQYRNSLAESMVRVFKLAMQKCNLKNKKFTLLQWVYITQSLTFFINQRVLNVRYVEEEMQALTPAHLIFGSRIDYLPQDSLQIGDNMLFQRVKQLDEDLKVFQDKYYDQYLTGLLEYRKFKRADKPLNIGSIVFVKDKINPETRRPCLAVVIEKKSDRTYLLKYHKRKPKLDAKTLQIIDQGKTGTLERASQNLVNLGSSETEISTEFIFPSLLGLNQNENMTGSDNLIDRSSDINSDQENFLETNDFATNQINTGIQGLSDDQSNIQDIQGPLYEVSKTNDALKHSKKPILHFTDQNIEENMTDRVPKKGGKVKRITKPMTWAA